jgi:hypothetical protein
MQRFNESELSHRINETIIMHLESGEPTAREISQDVLAKYPILIRQFAYELAESKIFDIVSDRMKKQIATQKGGALQLKLPIEIAALQPETAISFRDNSGVIRYVAIIRATAEHHRRYIVLLREQIQADTNRLRTEEMFYAWLEPVFRSNPGITTAEAIDILNEQSGDDNDDDFRQSDSL